MSTMMSLIGGTYRPGTGGRETRSPSDLADVVGEYMHADQNDVDAAVEAARGSFPSWSRASPQIRFELLDRAGQLLLARRDQVGRLLAREEGKLLSEGVAEVTRAAHILKYFAGEALRMGGETLSSVRSGVDVEVRREALGVYGLITPWNFPIAIPAWKIAPALAYGNTVVIKPSDLAPGCAWTLVDILRESGAPPGVVNLVMGRGAIVGQALLESRDIDAISFTGSIDTGRALIAQSANSGKRVQAEMGGKNPMVVLDDADLDVAVSAAISGAFFSTGQRCTASSRIIVTSGIFDSFVERFQRQALALRVGHALEDNSQMGPVVSESQLQTNLRYLQIARDEGATVVGGALVDRPTRGHFMQPAVLLDTTPEMRVNQEEIFGPVASVIRVHDYDEALTVANGTPFGLVAGICTRSLSASRHFKANARAGMVMVNLATAGVDYHVPFGGMKRSSYGPREQGHYAQEFYTAVKTIYTA